MLVQNFGGHTAKKIAETKNMQKGKKRQKFSTFYDNFRIWAQISLKVIKIKTKSKRRWREGFFGRCKKIVKFGLLRTKL